MGLLFKVAGYDWPNSKYYLDHILPTIKTILTTKSLQLDMLCRLVFNPFNWRFALERANILSMSIKSLWGVNATLDDLPKDPVWSINGTTAENGRRFRFKAGMIGDYETGYAKAKAFKIADAMAVSAAFPGGIGPLRVDASRYHWFKRKSWGADVPEEEVSPPYDTIHLYDGGVYDNLGLEPLFDIGKQIIKTEFTVPIDFLIVADASAPFSRGALSLPMNPFRLIRVADIAFDQARALRVRSFVNFISVHSRSGMYLQIGSEPLFGIKRYAKPENIDKIIEACAWLSQEKVRLAASYKTTLRIMNDKDFDLIAKHAFQTSLWNELVFFGNGMS